MGDHHPHPQALLQATAMATPLKRKLEDDDDGEREESAVLLRQKHEQQGKEEQGGTLMAVYPKGKREEEEDDNDRDDEEEEYETEEEEAKSEDEVHQKPWISPAWAKYLNQLARSEGFDAEGYPDSSDDELTGCIVPVTDLHSSPSRHEIVTRLAKTAIRDYSKKNKEAYEFHSLVKANKFPGPARYYLITFKVKNLKAAGDGHKNLKAPGDSSDDGDENFKAAGDSSDENLKAVDDASEGGDESCLEDFQAKVWEDHETMECTVYICRPKPKE